MGNPKTLGQTIVGIEFNPSNESIVDKIKTKSAELIDLVDSIESRGPICEATKKQAIVQILMAQMLSVKANFINEEEDGI